MNNESNKFTHKTLIKSKQKVKGICERMTMMMRKIVLLWEAKSTDYIVNMQCTNSVMHKSNQFNINTEIHTYRIHPLGSFAKIKHKI